MDWPWAMLHLLAAILHPLLSSTLHTSSHLVMSARACELVTSMNQANPTLRRYGPPTCACWVAGSSSLQFATGHQQGNILVRRGIFWRGMWWAWWAGIKTGIFWQGLWGCVGLGQQTVERSAGEPLKRIGLL